MSLRFTPLGVAAVVCHKFSQGENTRKWLHVQGVPKKRRVRTKDEHTPESHTNHTHTNHTHTILSVCHTHTISTTTLFGVGTWDDILIKYAPTYFD